jgi:hypothetical protein
MFTKILIAAVMSMTLNLQARVAADDERMAVETMSFKIGRIDGEGRQHSGCAVQLVVASKTWSSTMSKDGCRIGANTGTWRYVPCGDPLCIELWDQVDERGRQTLTLTQLPSKPMVGSRGTVLVNPSLPGVVVGIENLDDWMLEAAS